ncbi:MAG: RagB/SusD family nutrient uptake outer membrane protein [Williamsia sp.]|nr:RagB/SusD family nutrient uptake outer membrane protein [Williamsia sp.]
MKARFFSYTMAAVCLAALSALMPSCKKYLEVQPISSFGPDYVFNSVVNARTAVLGAYASLGGDNGYGIRLSMYYPYDSDDMMGQGGTPYPDNERRDIAHYSLNSGNTQLAAPFNQLYQGVERANLCIYYIPKMDLYANGTANEQKELKRLHGEALTLRAQFYFELVRNWGDLPAQWQPSTFETDLFKPKMSRDSIYLHLLDDLKTAENLVPWRTEVAADERITQGAVRALRARIALFAGGYSLRQDRTLKRVANYKDFYQIAKDECAAVMARRDQHKLNATYQAVFKDVIDAHRIDPAGEVVFEVAMTGGSSSSGDSKLGYYNGPLYSTMSGTTTTNLGNAALTILPTYFYTFDSTDTRRDVTCAPYNNFSDGTKRGRALQSIVDGKFRRDWITNPVVLTSQAQYFGLNWPLIRFSDVLLMYAEADNELSNGPTTAAKNAFEEVRTRAYGNASLIGTTPTAYTDFFNALVKERQLEFGGEGIRKYDLIRWNLLAQRLTDAKAALTALSNRQGAYANLPANMYYKNSSADLVWLNSFYKPAPVTTAPAGYTSVAWAGTAVNTTILTYYAVGFTTGKSELLPIPQASLDANPLLKQDYGY